MAQVVKQLCEDLNSVPQDLCLGLRGHTAAKRSSSMCKELSHPPKRKKIKLNKQTKTKSGTVHRLASLDPLRQG